MPRSKKLVYTYFKSKRTTKEERRIARIADLDTHQMEKELMRLGNKSIKSRISKKCKEPLRLGTGLTSEMFAFEDKMDMPESYERTKTGREEELDKCVGLCLRALGRGKPSAVLTTPEVISESCTCRKKQRTMLHEHQTVELADRATATATSIPTSFEKECILKINEEYIPGYEELQVHSSV